MNNNEGILGTFLIMLIFFLGVLFGTSLGESKINNSIPDRCTQTTVNNTLIIACETRIR
jgi:hypothetical protein